MKDMFNKIKNNKNIIPYLLLTIAWGLLIIITLIMKLNDRNNFILISLYLCYVLSNLTIIIGD